jgi:hypothetical protein
MATLPSETEDVGQPLPLLDRPISMGWCVLGWLGATAIFVGLSRLMGGPALTDSSQSTYATWAIAHGHPSCAYGAWGFSGVAPLYPLLSAGVAAIAQIGHGVPFPTSSALGHNCSTAFRAMNHWFEPSKAVAPTIHIGYLSWLALMAGVVAVMRSYGRGRCGWELVTLGVVACAPSVLMPLISDFHPEDLLATGLALCGLALALRSRWVAAGILFGLAITTQQFAILIFAPLLVIAPAKHRLQFLGAAVAAAAAIIVPMLVITQGRMFDAISGAGATPSVGTTALAKLELHGPPLFFVARLLPIAMAMALAIVCVRRSRERIFEPVALLALLATSLSFRLLLEINLFGYYFSAVTVMLIVLAGLRRRFTVPLIIWLVALAVTYPPGSWLNPPFFQIAPIWVQVLLTLSAFLLSATPLWRAMRAPDAESKSAQIPGHQRLEGSGPAVS